MMQKLMAFCVSTLEALPKDLVLNIYRVENKWLATEDVLQRSIIAMSLGPHVSFRYHWIIIFKDRLLNLVQNEKVKKGTQKFSAGCCSRYLEVLSPPQAESDRFDG